MISRYSRPAAVALWSQETKYRIWFEIEAHAATKMAELGTIPASAAEAIWAKGKDVVFDADRIDEIERTTGERIGNEVRIEEGLREGQIIVSAGAHLLHEGQAVRALAP